jgi:hypothetical protein
MLLQPADDADGSAIAFGAWPCSWDVDFKLAAPMNTTVEGVFKNGAVHAQEQTLASAIVRGLCLCSDKLYLVPGGVTHGHPDRKADGSTNYRTLIATKHFK